MTETQIHRIVVKRIIAGTLLLATLAAVFLAATHRSWFTAKNAVRKPAVTASSAVANQRKVLYWYDPMHPAYKADKPGIAPDCGMALVPKYADEESALPMPSGTITLNETQQSLAGVRTIVARRAPLTREIHSTAEIVADESRIAQVHLKTSGYVNRVFVNEVGQYVRKGDRLFTLYSPDLVAAEEEYLIAKRGNASLASSPFDEVRQGYVSLLAAAKEKLKLYDVSASQIAQLDKTGKAERDLTFYSPVTGFVTERKVYPQTAITPETALYTISDYSTVWAVIDIFEYEAPYVHVGQRVTLALSYSPGKIHSGKISYIYPTVDPQTRTIKARVTLPNPHFELKPQMFADATLHIDYGRPLQIPQEAVLDSGQTQQVFVVHPGGIFEPRRISVGATVNDQIIVLSGLKEGETVVSSGNFLVDSESRLKTPAGGVQ